MYICNKCRQVCGVFGHTCPALVNANDRRRQEILNNPRLDQRNAAKQLEQLSYSNVWSNNKRKINKEEK